MTTKKEMLINQIDDILIKNQDRLLEINNSEMYLNFLNELTHRINTSIIIEVIKDSFNYSVSGQAITHQNWQKIILDSNVLKTELQTSEQIADYIIWLEEKANSLLLKVFFITKTSYSKNNCWNTGGYFSLIYSHNNTFKNFCFQWMYGSDERIIEAFNKKWYKYFYSTSNHGEIKKSKVFNNTLTEEEAINFINNNI